MKNERTSSENSPDNFSSLAFSSEISAVLLLSFIVRQQTEAEKWNKVLQMLFLEFSRLK